MNLFEMTKEMAKWAGEEKHNIEVAVNLLNENRRLFTKSTNTNETTRLLGFEWGFMTAFKLLSGMELDYDPLDNKFSVPRN